MKLNHNKHINFCIFVEKNNMTQIEEFPDYYIDENFEVWSNSYHPKSNKNCELRKLKPILNNMGYLSFCFQKNGKRYHTRLHRIIAELYIPNPENHPFVRHLDDNKLNNTLENLVWGTHLDNMNDKVKNGNSAKGEKHPKVKLTEQQVIEIRQKYIPIKYSTRKLAKEYGVSQSAIDLIINKTNWNHI